MAPHQCPVCSSWFPAGDIEAHVQLHFLEEEPPQQQAEEIVIDDEEDEEGLVHCPFGCGAKVALHELDSHEEAHRLQDMDESYQEGADRQLVVDLEHEQLLMQYGFSDKRPGKCFRCGEEGHWARQCPQGPAAAARPQQPLSTIPAQLVQQQRPDGNPEAHRLDIIPLLQACFEAQPKAHSTVYLSAPVGFHSGRGAADCGWGCGYRNIQMQVSHLLMKDGPHRQALFGGCGYVPDVASLQAWLEVAWQAGFDPAGAAMMGNAVQGTRKWIGTVEAAALLRYFGCKALLLEFHGRPPPTAVDASGATIHEGVECDVCGRCPIVGVRFKSYQTPNYDVCSSCRSSAAAKQHAPFRAVGDRGSGGAAAGSFSGSGAAGQGNILQQMWAAHPGTSMQQQQQVRQQPGSASSRNGQAASSNLKPSTSLSGGSGSSSAAEVNRKAAAERHRPLAEWIWTYFSQGEQRHQQQQQQPPPPPPAAQQVLPALPAASTAAGHSNKGSSSSSSGSAATNMAKQPRQHNPVILTTRPPLYLQHEGHSRTVVGIERCLSPRSQLASDAAAEYSLIILDPGMAAGELLGSLRSRQGWQRRVKRGIHSLAKNAEFQVLHVAPDLVPAGPQRDSLKFIKAEDVHR